jgi:hypothetical protein
VYTLNCVFIMFYVCFVWKFIIICMSSLPIAVIMVSYDKLISHSCLSKGVKCTFSMSYIAKTFHAEWTHVSLDFFLLPNFINLGSCKRVPSDTWILISLFEGMNAFIQKGDKCHMSPFYTIQNEYMFHAERSQVQYAIFCND